jgi:hypothetical protein
MLFTYKEPGLTGYLMASSADFGKPRGKKKNRKPLPGHGMAALKALVTIYGPREAARRAGIPEGTVLSISYTNKWKKATGFKPVEQVPIGAKDPADVIIEALASAKEESTLNLAEYTRKASLEARNSKAPLDVARKVRDVAGIFQVLYPPETEEGLIEASILLGDAKVTPNPEEILARAIEIEPVQDVRTELSDQRPAGG